VNGQGERLFGHTRDELIGKQVEILVPERFQSRHPQHREGYVAHPRTRLMGDGLESRGPRKDGTEFPVEIGLSPLESPEGILITSAIRDITARKKAEERLVEMVGELKRSNDELQEVEYVASDEIREPLRMVASCTQLLAKPYKGRLDSNADEFIAFAVDGSNRMQAMIQDLSAYSRAGSNGKVARNISIEGAQKIALANLRAVITENHAVVTYDSLPAMTADDAQLTQIFQNLVGNSSNTGTLAPRIFTSAEKKAADVWLFSVRHNGLEMEVHYLDRIFVLFQRLLGREERVGNGMGLAICKNIVERFGGRIWVESQLGKGSTFYFTVPQKVAN
jgi:PAS domain S-box-containing protein